MIFSPCALYLQKFFSILVISVFSFTGGIRFILIIGSSVISDSLKAVSKLVCPAFLKGKLCFRAYPLLSLTHYYSVWSAFKVIKDYSPMCILVCLLRRDHILLSKLHHWFCVGDPMACLPAAFLFRGIIWILWASSVLFKK